MLKPEDLRLILHQFANILQPIVYHVEKLKDLKTDEPIFNNAMVALPGRLQSFTRVIDRLRVLSKTLELNPGRVNLNALLRSLTSEIVTQPEFAAVKCSFDFPAQCAIPGDEYWLHTALRELLQNAAEAAAPSPTPRLRTIITREDSMWRIDFEDSGPGLPVDAKEFKLFASTKSGSGSGLGLSIARHVIDAHGGRLQFPIGEDRKGVVSVYLPV